MLIKAHKMLTESEYSGKIKYTVYENVSNRM